MIIPFAAGGPTDVLGRVIAQRMSEIMGQQVVCSVGSVSKFRANGTTLCFLQAASAFALEGQRVAEIAHGGMAVRLERPVARSEPRQYRQAKAPGNETED
jgi:hypothetical protein